MCREGKVTSKVSKLLLGREKKGKILFTINKNQQQTYKTVAKKRTWGFGFKITLFWWGFFFGYTLQSGVGKREGVWTRLDTTFLLLHACFYTKLLLLQYKRCTSRFFISAPLSPLPHREEKKPNLLSSTGIFGPGERKKKSFPLLSLSFLFN